jgi:hypothetical protein
LELACGDNRFRSNPSTANTTNRKDRARSRNVYTTNNTMMGSGMRMATPGNMRIINDTVLQKRNS